MRERVTVEVESIITSQGEREVMHLTGRGFLRQEEGRWHLRYVAQDGENQRSSNTLTLCADTVTVDNVSAGYTMQLKPHCETALRISAGGAALELWIHTHRIRWDLDDPDNGTIELNYAMLAGSEIVSDISLRIHLRKE